MNISKETKIVKVLAPTATGTSTINTSVVDMQGYDGVIFLGSIGSAAANNGMKVQQGAISDGSAAADLAGSLAGGASKTDLLVEVTKPQKRYVRAAVVRGTTTTIDCVWAILYRGIKQPVDNSGAAVAQKLLVAPIEGTA